MDNNNKPRVYANVLAIKQLGIERLNRQSFLFKIDLLQLTVITSIGFRLAGDKLQDHYTKLILWYGDSEESLKYMKDKTGKLTVKNYYNYYI